jgi:hypothetical protein
VVMGQGHGNDTSVILAAAGEAAQQLVDSVGPTAGGPTIASPTVAPRTRTATRSSSLPVPGSTDVNANDQRRRTHE